jgi:hypothetical protein
VLAAEGCADDDPPPADRPDSGALTTDKDASSVSPSCNEACAQTASSSACSGKTYKEDSCREFCPCMVGAFRPDLVPGALACIAGCREGGEDQCLEGGFASYVDDPETKGTVTACSARQADCRDAGESLGTDVCALVGAKPEFLAKINSCLTLSCADARACIASAYGEAGCGD